MAIDILQTLDIIEALENFIDKIRPPEEMRDQYDISYKIDDQSVIVYEIRPHWQKKNETIESPIAKTTFIKAKNHWKILWFRADLKWHAYKPNETVNSLKHFLEIIEEDKHGCFWG